jgi:sodium/hydrogen exchanger family protein
MEPVQLAAILAAVVVLASVLSVELGIAVALFELGLGVVVGNVFELQSQEWLDFIAAFASIVLTFLAGLEVDPGYFRTRFGASVGIGLVSFIGPFIVGSLVAYLALDWTLKASLIAGTALSTTSLAVIYAVLVEDGLNETALGKLLDERHVRHRPGHCDRALGDLHRAERLVSRLPGRLTGAGPGPSKGGALVLPPLWEPGDRARDQARLRLPVRADGAG